MKAYYAAVSKQSDSEPSLGSFVTQTIPRLMEMSGCEVVTYLYNPLEPDRQDGFAETTESIRLCDIFVGEMSSPSQTLGFQLAYALSLGKPTLYVYKDTRSGRPDSSLAKHPSRLMRIASYDDSPSFERVFERFLEHSKNQMNSTRTSFMSTHRIDTYIGRTAKKMSVSKAEVIRQLLDESIDRNSERF